MVREFVLINFRKAKESICTLCITINFKYMVETATVRDNLRRLLNIYTDILQSQLKLTWGISMAATLSDRLFCFSSSDSRTTRDGVGSL